MNRFDSWNERMAGAGYDAWLLHQADLHEAEPEETEEEVRFDVTIGVDAHKTVLSLGGDAPETVFPEASRRIGHEISRLIATKAIDTDYLMEIDAPVFWTMAEDGRVFIWAQAVLHFEMEADGRGCTDDERRDDARELIYENHLWLLEFCPDFDVI